jgi:Fe-Mn family superoxide dismutase
MKLETNGDLKKILRKSLNLEENNSLQESYVAQQKTFESKTETLSKQAHESHIELYSGYLNKFNQVSAQLDSVDRKSANSNASDFRSLKLDEIHNINGIYLHELFFANVGANNSAIHVDSLSYMRLDRDFGGFDRWQADFIATGLSSREGWVACCLSTYLKRYINVMIDGHTTNIPFGCFPIIVVDMWSHSYYRDFLNDKGKYLRKMMAELNWDIVENRFERAEKIVEALR